MEAVAYLRVSSQGQIDGYGLDLQEHDVRTYAERNDITVKRWCVDSVSGTKDDADRPGLMEAMQSLADGETTILLAAKLDRIARAVGVQEAILARIWRLPGPDRQVHTADVGLVPQDDPDDPMRTAMRQMAAVFHQLDKAMIVKRLKDGRRHKARVGKAVGSYPYGWAKDGPVADEQRTRALAERLRSEGATLAATVAELNRLGSRTRSGREWTISGLHNVLARANAPHPHHTPS